MDDFCRSHESKPRASGPAFVPPATVPGTPVPRPTALGVETDRDFPSQSAREGPHSIKDHLRGWQHLQHAPSIARAGHDRRARGHARPGLLAVVPLAAALIDEAQVARIAGAVVFVVPPLSLSAAMDGDVMAQELLERPPATRPVSSMQRETLASRFAPAATRKTSNVWSRAPALPIQAPGPASPFTASCGSCCAPG